MPASPTKPKPPRRWASAFAAAFSGLLHLEIIRERLEREFDLDLIATAPSVIYRIHMTDGTMIELHNPADMPEVTKIDKIEEPWIRATIFVPDEYLGAVLKLCEDRRGSQVELTYAGNRAMVVYRVAAERSGVRFLRPAEIGFAAAMPASTITSRAITKATWSRCRSWSMTSRWMRCP